MPTSSALRLPFVPMLLAVSYRTLLVLAIVGLGGCGSDPAREVLAEACKLKRDRPSALMSYVNDQGAVVYERGTSVSDLSPKAIYAAVAGTETKVIACWGCGTTMYGFFGCGWVRCDGSPEEDTRRVYGLARATTRGEAEFMALDNCRRIADRFAADNGISRERIDCKLLRSSACFRVLTEAWATPRH